MWQETVLLSAQEQIDVELTARSWRLAYLRRRRTLLAFEGGPEAGRCLVGGSSRPYRFRSVEQLRYDFERELRILRDGGIR